MARRAHPVAPIDWYVVAFGRCEFEPGHVAMIVREVENALAYIRPSPLRSVLAISGAGSIAIH